MIAERASSRISTKPTLGRIVDVMRTGFIALALAAACTSREIAGDGSFAGSGEGSASEETMATSMQTTLASTSSTSTSSESTAGCERSFEIGAFTKLAEIGMGQTELYDVDRDGRLDVVGSIGTVVTADLEVEFLPGTPTLNDGHPGMFDGDAVVDFVYVEQLEGALVVLPGNGGDPIITATSLPFMSAVADVDDDGIDDIAFTSDDGMDAWRGNGDGTFAKFADITSHVSAFFSFVRQPDGMQLAIGDSSATDFEVYRVTETPVLVGRFSLMQGFSVDSGDAFGDGSDDLLVTQAWLHRTTPSSVALLHPDGETWDGWTVDFTGQVPWNAALGDVDEDGIAEIVVANGDESLTILCWTGDGFARCGQLEVGAPARQAELLPGRVVSAGPDPYAGWGIWVAEVTSSACR
jgi:hypothetical protein